MRRRSSRVVCSKVSSYPYQYSLHLQSQGRGHGEGPMIEVFQQLSCFCGKLWAFRYPSSPNLLGLERDRRISHLARALKWIPGVIHLQDQYQGGRRSLGWEDWAPKVLSHCIAPSYISRMSVALLTSSLMSLFLEREPLGLWPSAPNECFYLTSQAFHAGSSHIVLKYNEFFHGMLD